MSALAKEEVRRAGREPPDRALVCAQGGRCGADGAARPELADGLSRFPYGLSAVCPALGFGALACLRGEVMARFVQMMVGLCRGSSLKSITWITWRGFLEKNPRP